MWDGTDELHLRKYQTVAVFHSWCEFVLSPSHVTGAVWTSLACCLSTNRVQAGDVCLQVPALAGACLVTVGMSQLWRADDVFGLLTVDPLLFCKCLDVVYLMMPVDAVKDKKLSTSTKYRDVMVGCGRRSKVFRRRPVQHLRSYAVSNQLIDTDYWKRSVCAMCTALSYSVCMFWNL